MYNGDAFAHGEIKVYVGIPKIQLDYFLLLN